MRRQRPRYKDKVTLATYFSVIFLSECKGNRSDEPMVGLADLIEGAAHSYLGDKDESIECYRNCLKHRNPSNDAYDRSTCQRFCTL